MIDEMNEDRLKKHLDLAKDFTQKTLEQLYAETSKMDDDINQSLLIEMTLAYSIAVSNYFVLKNLNDDFDQVTIDQLEKKSIEAVKIAYEHIRNSLMEDNNDNH